MSLIELSEQLKDVPDQFLIKEVQNPTGAYPAYLVVSELTRRKRMRENVMKEAPSTTVAQDLAAPPPQAGLGALPEAQQSLAAQDAMGTTPPEMMMQQMMPQEEMPAQGMDMPVQGMREGGVVAFSDGGLSLDVYGQPQATGSAPFWGDLFGGRLSEIERARQLNALGLSRQDINAMSAEEQIDYLRGMEANALQRKAFESAKPAATPAAPAAPAPAGAAAPGAAPAGGPQPGAAPNAAPSSPLISFKNPYATDIQGAYSSLLGVKDLTDEEIAAQRAAGASAYKEAVPYRYEPFEKELQQRTDELKDRRGSNINEALIQAGLGIMGSKSPYFAQAISEGGLSALKAYREGVKDLRDAETQLMGARMKMSEARSAYDKEGYLAGAKQAEIAQSRVAQERDRLSKIVSAGSTLGKEARDQAMFPYEVEAKQAAAASSRGYAEYLRDKGPGLDKTLAKPDQINAARIQAITNLGKKATPAQVEAMIDQILAQSGLKRATAGLAASPSLDRGTL